MNGLSKRWLYAMSKEKYGKYTYWIRLVDDVEQAINNTISQSTQMSPMELRERVPRTEMSQKR